MEELINRILEIEEQAQEVVRASRRASSELEERINSDTMRLKNEIDKKKSEKNASLVQLEEEGAEEKISAINAETEKAMANLEETYRQNKDKWVNDIVKGVIGGEE